MLFLYMLKQSICFVKSDLVRLKDKIMYNISTNMTEFRIHWLVGDDSSGIHDMTKVDLVVSLTICTTVLLLKLFKPIQKDIRKCIYVCGHCDLELDLDNIDIQRQTINRIDSLDKLLNMLTIWTFMRR